MPGTGGKNWRVTAKRPQLSSWDEENVLELDCGGGCTTCSDTKNHWMVCFKKDNFYSMWIISQKIIILLVFINNFKRLWKLTYVWYYAEQ